MERVEVERGRGVEDEDARRGASPAGTAASAPTASRSRSARRTRTRASGRRSLLGARPPRAGPPRSSARRSAARGSPRAGRLALSSSNAREGARQARGDDGPSPRSRASEIAEETLWVSASVSRSDSISVSAYWRWPPGDRCGRGEAVAPLPAAQRVGADAEHDRRRVGSDSIHCASYGLIGSYAQSPHPVLQIGGHLSVEGVPGGPSYGAP